MNTKIISSWLLAFALWTPLGVWAAGENTEESCLATYSVIEQTLTLPCVEVVMGNETALYSAQLQQVEEGRFALTQVAELSAAVESECVASYSLETGELGVPCVEEVNPPEVAETRALVLYAEEPGSPSVFVEVARDRAVRAADKNLSVAFLPQSPPGDPSKTKNCGQTSVLMVMSFYKGISPTVQGIKDIDDWLYQQYNDPVDSYNGSYTNVTKLLAVAKKMGGFTNSYYKSGWGLNDLKQQIDNGVPVITAIKSGYIPFSDRGYRWTGGHFVVVKGYTSTHMIVNDPGTKGGADKYYRNADFEKAFAAQNGYVVVVVAGGLKLDSDITMTPNPAVQGQPVTITAKISNRDGTENFKGNLYAAFHPQGDAMVTLFEIKLPGQELNVGQDFAYPFGTAALNLAPGTYQLYIKGNDAHALTGPHKNPITVKVVSAGKATKAPTIVAPANSSQNNSADGVTFQWANNNDPATITSLYFSLREADGDNGKAGAILCKDLLLTGKAETLPSSTCGQLKSNQWYKWAVYLTFNNGSVKQGLVGYFKTSGSNVATTKAPTIVSPSNHSQNNNASGMILQWSNNNDPAVISGVYLSLRETSGDNVENAGTTLGDCKDRLLVGIPDTFSTTSCGALKPNQWYKWAVYLKFKDGSSDQGFVGYFKTGGSATTNVPTIVNPVNHSQNSSPVAVALQWSINNDPSIISDIRLSLRETAGDNVENAGAIVGDCKDKPIGMTNTFSATTCGALKPNQWYKWAVYLKFNNGSSDQGFVGYFKTMENGATNPPTLLNPANHSEIDFKTASNLVFQWVNNNPTIIVSRVDFVLKETTGDNGSGNGNVVGVCNILPIGVTESFPVSSCGGTLKPNQWYVWAIRLVFTDGTTQPVLSYFKTSGSGVKMVSAGGMHSCALKADGNVICWGNNDYGQATPPSGTFTQISTGSSHTCGLRTDGTLVCWGLSSGLGNAPPGTTVTPPGSPTFKQVVASWGYTCGLKTDGAIQCWNKNPTFSGTVTQLGASPDSGHICALKTDGSVGCWGLNKVWSETTPTSGTFSQLSDICGVKTDATVTCWRSTAYGEIMPPIMPPSGTFSQVSSTVYNNACGIKTDGTLACWGENGYGQATPPSGIFSQISMGSFYGCGVKTDGTVACWGYNDYGNATPPAELTVKTSP